MIRLFKTHTALVLIASVTGCGTLWGVVHMMDKAKAQATHHIKRTVQR